jgi:hypothetical protein
LALPLRPPGDHRFHAVEDVALCADPQLGLFNKGRANMGRVRFRLAHPGLLECTVPIVATAGDTRFEAPIFLNALA